MWEMYKQLKRMECNVHNGIRKLSFLFSLSPSSFSKQPSFPQLSMQSSLRENEVHSCRLKGAFKVEYSSDKGEGSAGGGLGMTQCL